MQTIALQQVPNQRLSANLDGNRWDIVVKEADGIMFVDLTMNDVAVLTGQRVVAGTPAIPYEYLQGFGNFLFLTEGEALPYWDRFTIDQQLVYVSAGEVVDA